MLVKTRILPNLIKCLGAAVDPEGKRKWAIRKGAITGVERLEEADRGQKEGTGARGGVLGGV